MSNFYTYMWLRASGTPYYAGKGYGVRAFVDHGTNHRPKDDARILVQHWESEEKAFEIEKWLISFFGRKDLGTGLLHNLTDGGDGPVGYKPTPAARLTQSIRMKTGLRPHHLITTEERTRGGRKSAATVLTLVGRLSKVKAGRKAMHIRWHVNTGSVREGCELCV